MALNSSGPISLGGSIAGQSIAVELGLGATTQISLNDANVRTLSGDTTAGSPVVMPQDFYSKSNTVIVNITYSSNQSKVTIDATTISGYVAGKTQVNVTINSGVTISSDNTSVAAITVTGFALGDVINITNTGTIVGAGGAAGNKTSNSSAVSYPGNYSGAFVTPTFPNGYDGSGYPTGPGVGGSTPGYNTYSGGTTSGAGSGGAGGPAIALLSNAQLNINNNSGGLIVGGGGGAGGQAGNNAGGGAGANGGYVVTTSGSHPTVTLVNQAGGVVASGGGGSGGWGNRYENDGIGGRPGYPATNWPSGQGNYGGNGLSPGVAPNNATALINTAGTFTLSLAQ